ncbi:MAG: hemolysin family protein [Candidatus Hydrogenedentes bacterium]|nr:hemolysin family protein [Candidatus Hydrogenedentota bacterium]
MTWGMLTIFIFFVILAGLFSGFETGFVSVNPIRIRALSAEGNSRRAQMLLRYLNNPDYLFVVLLLGTNFCLVGSSIAMTKIIPHPLYSLLVTSLIFLYFGEILPKTVFRLHPNVLCELLVPFIVFFDYLLKPFSVPLAWVYSKILGKNDRFISISSFMRSPEDVKKLVEQGVEQGEFHKEEQELIQSVFDLQQKVAKEIMVPRIEICAVPKTATRSELIKVFRENRFTRIPVYENTIDKVVGIIKAFDLLKDKDRDNENINRFLRPVSFVTDSTPLDEVLKLMRQRHQTMVIVLDEYGGTAGLVTLEDILEEVFGEIRDEHDQEEPPIRQMGPGDYIINARTSLEELREKTQLEIFDDEVETVGGWLLKKAQRVPQKGEVLITDSYRITIVDGKPNCVLTIRLEVLKK